MKRIISVFGKAFCAGMLGLSVQSCGLIYDEYSPDYESGEFRIRVNVQTGKDELTRADHTDDSELKGSAAENFIDFDSGNFRIAIFNNDGTHLLDVDRSDWNVSSSEDSYYVYHVIDIALDLPEGTTKQDKERIKTEGVRVMALANWNTPTDNSAYESIFTNSDDSRQNLGEIWADDEHYNFSYRAESDGATWLPSTADRKLIPMFGIGKSSPFSVSTGGGEYRTSVVVPMQRALAKVEVINNIEPSKGSISNVTMSSFNDSGRFIPDVDKNPDWDKIGAQVDVSSLPKNVVTNDRNLTFVQEGNKWVAYIPEMELGSTLNNDRPHINVQITGTDGIENNIVHFAQYNDVSEPSIPDESWNHVLRNHIYRYVVTRGSIRTNIHLHVIPWIRDEEEIWDFTDHVSVQTLSWQGYDHLVSETGEVYLSFEESLKGIFQIMSPVNGRWMVKLVPLGDAKPGAVTFVDAFGRVMEPSHGEPPYCLEISGIIPGPANSVMYIAPTDIGDDQESRFRLEFYVENVGNWVEVPMVTNSTVSNYTIIRKANLIQ